MEAEIAQLEEQRAEDEAAKAALPGRLEAEKESDAKRDAKSLQRLAAEVARFHHFITILQTFEGFRVQAEDIVAKMKEAKLKALAPNDEDGEVDLDDPQWADMYE